MDEQIILTGFISEEEKACCYRNAPVFVYPSLYEGFGLPVLEAMEAGTPVVASHAASIPEVGGDACAHFDPHSAGDLAAEIEQLLANNGLRQSLRDKGFRRARQFTWRRTAEETPHVYEQCFRPKKRWHDEPDPAWQRIRPRHWGPVSGSTSKIRRSSSAQRDRARGGPVGVEEHPGVLLHRTPAPGAHGARRGAGPRAPRRDAPARPLGARPSHPARRGRSRRPSGASAGHASRYWPVHSPTPSWAAMRRRGPPGGHFA
jgi:hypothetical protein